MISFKLKGSSILSMALASAVITASIAYSVSKMNHVIFNDGKANGAQQTENLDVPSSSGMTFNYGSNSWS